MAEKLNGHGISLALVIDKPILELLKIDSDTPLDIKTDGESLIVSPRRPQLTDAAFENALHKVNEEFGDVLQSLAK